MLSTFGTMLVARTIALFALCAQSKSDQAPPIIENDFFTGPSASRLRTTSPPDNSALCSGTRIVEVHLEHLFQSLETRYATLGDDHIPSTSDSFPSYRFVLAAPTRDLLCSRSLTIISPSSNQGRFPMVVTISLSSCVLSVIQPCRLTKAFSWTSREAGGRNSSLHPFRVARVVSDLPYSTIDRTPNQPHPVGSLTRHLHRQ